MFVCVCARTRDKSDSGNCRGESKVRSYGDGKKETVLNGVVRVVSLKWDMSSELKGESHSPQLVVHEHFLAKEVAKRQRP